MSTMQSDIESRVFSPYLRIALDYTIPPEWQLKERVIFDYELFLVKEGKIKLCVEEEIFIGVPGDVFLIHPNKKHSIESIGSELFRHPHIHFDIIEDSLSHIIPINYRDSSKLSSQESRYFRKDILAHPPFLLETKLKLYDSSIIERYLTDLIRLSYMKSISSKIMSKGILSCLIAEILEQQTTNFLATGTVNTALCTAEEILRDATRSDTIEEIASICGYSKSHFIKEFSIAYSKTPHQYRISCRMNHAKLLLKGSNLPIAVIAELSGYQNPISFCNAFREYTGLAPSQYRVTI